MSGECEKRVYFDNAATTWPKPDEVLMGIARYIRDIGGSPGRAGHRMSIDASRLLEETRDDLARLFKFPDPLRIAFTKNVTEALNTAIFSLAPPGGHVVTSAAEHNSVMRPLRHLEKNAGVRISMAATDAHGRWSVDSVLAEVRPDTAVVVLGHASNVTGLHTPVDKLIPELERLLIPLIVDGAQSAGAMEVDLSRANRVVYGFTGHKSMLGPTGTGGMCIGEDVDVSPRVLGGTGSLSDQDFQPAGYPDSLESGTPNIVGVAGLQGALSYINRTGLAEIRRHESELMGRFIDQASDTVKDIVIYGTGEAEDYVATVSFNLPNLDPSKAGLILDRKYGIMSRIGLHCNPNCHKSIGTFPVGTVRFSFSPFTTVEDIDYGARCLAEMVELK